MKAIAPAAYLLLLAAIGCRSDESSPLTIALSNNNFPEAVQLLDDGADPNTTYHGAPVIYWALMAGEKTLADKLAEKGADLDISIGDERMIDLFEREAGADPKAKASRDAVDFLLAHGVKRRP